MEKERNIACLKNFKTIDEKAVSEELEEALKTFKRKIVVLDDDPTGVQTVHDVSVYTDWSLDSVRKGFEEESRMFFILTNSRGMTVKETTEAHRSIAANCL
ncbi:MAG: four-carbon acid sugar kinase family protein, partial [Eubacterium sp.]